MKTLTKKTHIGRVRQHNREGMHQVCHLLQCTEQDYCNYLFEQYCLFVQVKYKAFPDAVLNRILYSGLFRGMFNNAVAQRDESEFLPFADDCTSELTVVKPGGDLEVYEGIPLGSSELVAEWKETHSYNRLLQDDHFLNQFEHVLNLILII
ncbi:hypothetical protein [Pedobacter sp. WC2423]|uniref:hypothetical protein n=1 Tax=Pedobacter sp. WC2423 TaxID=3234142 RepID=UPI003465F322